MLLIWFNNFWIFSCSTTNSPRLFFVKRSTFMQHSSSCQINFNWTSVGGNFSSWQMFDCCIYKPNLLCYFEIKPRSCIYSYLCYSVFKASDRQMDSIHCWDTTFILNMFALPAFFLFSESRCWSSASLSLNRSIMSVIELLNGVCSAAVPLAFSSSLILFFCSFSSRI